MYFKNEQKEPAVWRRYGLNVA